MRLIDADELIKRLEKDPLFPLVEQFNISGVIENAPTIEAEPVKHGRWINDNGLYKCSACNTFTITGWASCIPIDHMNKTMRYCNNCGARMDLEGERK